jgi:serine/threonine-protein kinase SRPK3
LNPRDVDIAETVTLFQGEEKLQFLNFVSRMLQWLPGERSTAKDLLKDPFLKLPEDD